MPIIEPVIRPPAERDSFLLQVTTGCSSNNCSFCGAYRNKPFTLKDEKEILSDIHSHAKSFPETRKVFLLDGDALAVSNSKLIPVLDALIENFPKIRRISSYANGYNITMRSIQELKQLREKKLNLIYIGLESGNQGILDRCFKKAKAKEMITAVQQANSVGIKSSVIVLLGLGGKQYSDIHIRDTIAAVNEMQPKLLSFLTLMLIPGTDLYKDAKEGRFEELSAQELLKQTYDIIKGLKLKKTIFRTNHASNYLPLEGRFPQDKHNLLTMLEKGLQGEVGLKPERFRGL